MTGAGMVNAILSGVPAREIAFDRPMALRLIINLKAAEALGIAKQITDALEAALAGHPAFLKERQELEEWLREARSTAHSEAAR